MVELSGCNCSEDDVVISGIGGRFPLSENMAELEYHLFNKTPMVKNVEDLNWNRDDLGVPDCIGRMKDLNKFDTSYFGISPIMTKHMDPMTRITLETTFEAIVDSVIPTLFVIPSLLFDEFVHHIKDRPSSKTILLD
uniref:Beta-ketoacyl synthase-like N-terminal domain-containing protein n=1 Tax=Timema douglasi TaxID=61478 RepID=A0A7R8VH29_TIMDO|nr:unnamed protein product [Timema douglasi]